MIRRPSAHELRADFLYLVLAATASLLVLFVFDIHWSFYPGETIVPPSRRVFESDLTPYFIGVPIGSIVGFFLLKLMFFAMMEEEQAHRRPRRRYA